MIAYYRVSTQRQGQSGLGLEAQQAAVNAYAGQRGATVLRSYTEVESGRKSDRPELSAALADAKRSGAVLLVAKIDRLARNVAFIANLLEGDVEVAACDMPDMNRLVLHIMAAVAEHEAKAISERTKAALAARKARGLPMGWQIEGRTDMAKAHRLSAEVRRAQADAFAAKLAPRLQAMRDKAMTLQAIADELNELGVATARKGRWHATTVKAVLDRAASTKFQSA